MDHRVPPRLAGDAGTGLIATVAALVVFFVFLLFSVQVLVDLYASSVTTSAAFDGARIVAGSRADHDDDVAMRGARARAEARVRAELGTFGRSVTLDWSGTDDDDVQLRVQGDPPRFLWPGLQHTLGMGHVDRTVRVRVERWR